MIDKRKFHYFLNQVKDTHPNNFALIESIQDEFEDKVEPLTKEEKKALKTYPIQYVKAKELEQGEWTSQLHVWAEQCVPEILELDPIYLAYKNSAGDSVLMSFIVGCTGAYTEKLDYHLLNKLLNTDLSYEEIEKDGENDEIVMNNVFDEKDLNNQTPIDYLIEFAYGIGQFKGEEKDEKLKYLLKKFAENESKQKEEQEKLEQEVEESEPEEEISEMDEDMPIEEDTTEKSKDEDIKKETEYDTLDEFEIEDEFN